VPIQTEIIHIHIVIVSAVLYAVDQFEDHKFARETLLKFHSPIYEARRRKDPENRQTVEVLSNFQGFAQFVSL